jgi:arginine decarboxylase
VQNPARKPTAGSPWKIEDSLDLYGVNAWGNGYFGINAEGHVVVRPDQTADHEIDLHEVIRGLEARDLTTPVVVRFSDILRHRLKRLHDAFASAIAENDYRNRYSAVFPIKVNQQRLVVEEVYGYGREFGFGLEVGSKPELLAVMAMTEGESERMIVCNGFKDDSYIEAVILATKLGRTIIPVVENFDELGLILKHARAYEVRPRIGVRVKLASEGAGRWRESSGEKSKFGLFVTEILELFRVLREARDGGLPAARALPPGQPAAGHPPRQGRRQRARARLCGAEADGCGAALHRRRRWPRRRLRRQPHQLRLVDELHAGGVRERRRLPDRERLQRARHRPPRDRQRVRAGDRRPPQPARVQHARQLRARSIHGERAGFAGTRRRRPVPQPVRDLRDAYRSITERRLVECYHDAQQAREQALQMFNLGYLSLEHRGLVERLYWATCAKIRDHCRRLETVPEELQGLESILSDIYFCNMSVFQSLPDSWAIDQLFPIMPVHRLDERPVRNAVLADITCDSDGKIDRFVSLRETKRTLELHELHEGEPYYLAAFMVGAYQETLGDLHNLFGDTHVVHIKLHEEGGWWIEETVKGDTAAEVLRYMRYDVDRLLPQLARDCERAVREGRCRLSESQALRRFYDGELNGYTYLEPA